MTCPPPDARATGAAAEARVVAIHQPNFLPWLGYFDKIARADVFILLDTVQFPKKAGTWMNRVRLLVGEEPSWITVPVVRSYHGLRSVRDTRIDDSRPWRVKMLRTIEQAYARAPFFDEAMPMVHGLITADTDVLADFNELAVRTLATAIGLDSGKIMLASGLGASGSATQLLINLTKAVGGNAYLAGGGAQGYQEDDKFEPADIRLLLQNFRHPAYAQPSDLPQPGLSVVDALMDCGFRGVTELLASTDRR